MQKQLVKTVRIFLSPLHIKLCLLKRFVRALDKESSAFAYFAERFPSLSEAKIKEGIFIGPQLGNHRSEDYVQNVNDLLKHYHGMGCNMSLKVHVLHTHLDYFWEIVVDVSDKHGERFHQDFLVMEQRFKGKWNLGMFIDYYWCIKKEDHTPHKRLRRTKVV